VRRALVLEGPVQIEFSDPYEPACISVGESGDVAIEVAKWLGRIQEAPTSIFAQARLSEEIEISASEGVRLRITVEELPASHTGTVFIEGQRPEGML